MSGELFSLAAGAALLREEGLLESFSDSCREAHEQILQGAREDRPGFGWYALPDMDLGELQQLVETYSSVRTVIQVGIGGSALGSLMLQKALAFEDNPSGKRRFFVVDNVDPRDLRKLENSVDPESSLLVVISKSGGTAETMANFLWLFALFEEKLGRKEALRRVVVLTDPQSGILREFVKETGCASLPIPTSVGGRFSVLSPVGLFGAALLNIPLKELLRGAEVMRSHIESSSGIKENSAWLWSVLSHLHEKKGRNISVLMPYADGLEDFAEWFAQLWGESLGKIGMGSTPVRALGAIDQHSQVQLYAEGPDDKFYTLIAVKKHPKDCFIPHPPGNSLEKLAYLEGHSLGEMLYAEAQATASALVEKKRPLFWLEIPVIDAFRLGGLIFFFEYATALRGMLMKINPFDQPGVEQGKLHTYGLMGRKGYESYREAVEEQKKIMYDLTLTL